MILSLYISLYLFITLLAYTVILTFVVLTNKVIKVIKIQFSYTSSNQALNLQKNN